MLDEINKRKVDLLITSANNIEKKTTTELNSSEKKIRDAIERCNITGGLVFICCFSNEQILEIIIAIEKIISEKPELSNMSFELYHTYKLT